MRQPAILGLTILGATFLLCMILAWAAATDTEAAKAVGPDSSPMDPAERSRPMDETLRACPLCGVNVPLGKDPGCPVIEALGFVMAESKRTGAEGPTMS